VNATSGEAAVELLKSDIGIELVLSDIVMPGMNGLELARFVRESRPGLAVILASGYSEMAAVAVREGFILLNKPYSLETLRSALAQVNVRANADAA
jgi:two-component system NtrC family sensor kinase